MTLDLTQVENIETLRLTNPKVNEAPILQKLDSVMEEDITSTGQFGSLKGQRYCA